MMFSSFQVCYSPLLLNRPPMEPIDRYMKVPLFDSCQYFRRDLHQLVNNHNVDKDI